MTIDAVEAADIAWAASEPPRIEWARGPWRLEVRGDEIAYLHYDNTLILRSVRAVARDRDWSTVPSVAAGICDTPQSLTLQITQQGLGADLVGTLTVTADADSLLVRFVAQSRSAFERNRIGLVVLHPPTLAGESLEVTHPDGTATSTRFPERISPQQPALDIRGLAWIDDGVSTTLEFAGDVFEMEDQRNWTDASYKTYSTPLELPFPVLIVDGERIDQSIRIDCARVQPRVPTPVVTRVRLVEPGFALPTLSISASTSPGEPPADQEPSARAVLVELDARASNWPAALDRARREAGARPLDIRIVAGGAGDVQPIVEALRGIPVVRLGVFSSDTHVSESPLWTALVDAARTAGISAELIGGARSHFTELNRTVERLPADLPALTFSITPQMHAIEPAQILESIAMQRRVITDAMALAGRRPVHVAPITLRSRFNAVATNPPPPDRNRDIAAGYAAEFVPDATDPRQASSAVAAWTVASAAALAVNGVASIGYFETWGARGVVDTDGRPFPVAESLAWLHELAGLPALLPEGSVPTGLWVLGGHRPDGVVVLAANLAPTQTRVEFGHEGAASLEATIPPLTAVRLMLG